MYKAPQYRSVLLPAFLLLGCNGRLDHVGQIPRPGAPPRLDAGPPSQAPSPVPVYPAPTAVDAGGLPAADAASSPPPVEQPPAAPPAAPPPTPRPRTALFVVGNPNQLSAADNKTQQELQKLMLTVTVADDGGPATAGNDKGIVVISASAADATVAGKFKDSAVPVVVLESFIYDDMGMTEDTQNTDYGATNATQVEIAAADSPVSGGLTGTIAVVSANAALHWGVPGNGAKVVATLANNEDRATVFTYEKGAAMVGLSAPARRVGLFTSQTASDRLNDNGIKLFAAAIEWALAN